MEEETVSYQLHSARVADFILCSQQPFVRFTALFDSLPSSEDKESFQFSLRNDPYDRFCCIDEGEDMLIGLKNITEDDMRVQSEVEWWRCSIAKYLDKTGNAVELGRIASLVERPVDVPRNIRLKDIVNSDVAKRFCINGPPDRLMLSKRVSEDEIEESKDTWRKRIHDFLYLQPKDISLTTLGSSVTRPTNMGGTRTKLIELLQTDPEERFHLIYRSPTETIVRVKLSDSQREWLHEKWRGKAVSVLLEQQRTMTLTELGTMVKRPSVHLGSTSSLRSVLTEDPQCRFILSGQGDNIRVRISADAELGRRGGKGPATAPADASTWAHVDKKVGRIASASGSSPTSKSAWGTLRHRQTTEAELTLLSARGARWNAKDGDSLATEDTTRGTAMSSPATSADMSTVDPATLPADSLDAVFAAHSSSWDWKNPLEDAMVRASIFPHTATAATVSAATVLALSAPIAPPGEGTRPTYREKLVPTESKGKEGNQSKAICRPSPASVAKTSELCPYAREYRPRGPAVDPVRPAASAVPIAQQLIGDWLPTVLVGFPPELIAQFSAQLQGEGFLSVQDLVVARALGQLTVEFLSRMGFKIGHCNRIFACLPAPATA